MEDCFWSVMIPTCGRIDLLSKTLLSVLNQQKPTQTMQIEIVDNSQNSYVTDFLKTIDNTNVTHFKQPAYVGMAENWNTCIERARGEWIHILHDDDLISPTFYSSMEQFIHRHNDVGMVFCSSIIIDEKDEEIPHDEVNLIHDSGILRDPLKNLITGNFIQTPCVVVNRRTYDRVGRFDAGLKFACDWDMWLRIANEMPIGYLEDKLAYYRVHTTSVTNRICSDGNNIRESIQVVNRWIPKLEKKERRRIRRRAYQNYSKYSLYFLGIAQRNKQAGSALIHAYLAFKLDHSLSNAIIFLITSIKYLHSYRDAVNRQGL